ncbi:MAG: CocE/NonD family hydrolase [Dehalococcoidia bacterium]
MKQTAIWFHSGTIKLQGYCYSPDADGTFPAVVLCHPHSLNGGSMSNLVIRTLGNALVERSMIAVMFNFRGVGKSEGSYGGGIGEQEDLIAALDWTVSQKEVDKERIGAAGYSFGGSVALPVAGRDPRIKALALVSPALDSSHIPYLRQYTGPKLIISGAEDDLILPGNVELWNKEAAEPKFLEFIEGADHFWFGMDDVVADRVADFFERFLVKNSG